ncbi:hypothetical protein KJ656_09620, partial [bacterium]|nr:hypothetical protein [bacterium]
MKMILLLSMFMGFNLHAGDLTQSLMERINYVKEHNDRSHLSIHAGSGDQCTKIQFIVTDSAGRKTGFKSFFTTERGTLRVKSYREIPNSSYGVDYVASIDTSVVPNGPESAVLDFFPPILKDTYTIQFIGIDDCGYHFVINFKNTAGEYLTNLYGVYNNYIVKGSTQQYSIYLDPTPGTPAPVIIKTVTFDTLRQDLTVAQQLKQLGDDKFVDSLIRMINLAEKLSIKCDNPKGHDKSKGHKKDKVCKPAIAILNMFIKRLEIANRKCDKPQDCDEEPAWLAFRKEHGKDKDLKDFFKEWDKDKWHKWKNKCKRFVTDEALNIIRGDA